MPAGRPRSEAAQKAILTATRQELADHGYDKLSIDRIAVAAGVAKQTVYRWYASKSALVAECLLHGYVATPSIEAPFEGNTRSDVTTWVHEFARQTTEPSMMSLIRAASAASAEDVEIAHRFDERLTQTRTSLAARLEHGEVSGDVRAGAPLTTAAEVIVGALQYRLLTRQEIPEDFVRDVVDIVFTGVART